MLVALGALSLRTQDAVAQDAVSRPLGTPPATSGAVADHYGAMAVAMYTDALRGARILQQRIGALVSDPSEATFAAAKQAWIDARRRYSQTEAYRFGNPNVDAWEGAVNAWPIDEGFLDYVAAGYEHDLGNPHARENLIASDLPLEINVIRQRHERSGIEPNVATGFHAIEFLLWGQDMNAAPADAGQRPYTDYAPGSACTGGHCERRGRYLRLVSNMLVFELRNMLDDWLPQQEGYWTLYDSLPARERLRRIVTGLGTMSAGELAGERLSVALLAHSQEDEQSCFSDTTHLDAYYNAVGIRALYLGRYVDLDGHEVLGASLSDLVAARDGALDSRLRAQLDASVATANEIVSAAESGTPFDRMIQAENAAGRATIEKLIEQLTAQAGSFEAVQALIDAGAFDAEVAEAEMP
jgi:putative iron-regulated protein